MAAAALLVVLAVVAAGFFARQAHEAEKQRLADEQKRQAEIRVEKRQAAMEKAILAAMSGRLADADAALLESERLGAELAERRFIAGILRQYRGEPEAASRLLLEACSERPDWVAPLAFLAVVCNYAEDWEGEAEYGNRAFKLRPVTPDDYLFRGYMIGFTNPRRGLPDVKEAYKLRPSVLAQFIRAEVLIALADDSGSPEEAVTARDALRSVRILMGDSPMTTTSALELACIGCSNCRTAKPSRDAEAKAWLAEADADFRAAASLRDNRATLLSRTAYVALRDGNADALDAENRKAGLSTADSTACYSYVASLFRRGETGEALDYLNHMRRTGSDCEVFFRVAFLVGHDLPAAQAECRRALAGRLQTRVRPHAAYAASLAGLPDKAREAAKTFCDEPGVYGDWDDTAPFVRRVTRHAYEGMPMDVEAEMGPSRWKRFLGYDTLGFAALGQGRLEEARKWFRKADECHTVFSVSYLWMHELRRRIINDPTFPPWLATKS
jgi:hypothetical protein